MRLHSFRSIGLLTVFPAMGFLLTLMACHRSFNSHDYFPLKAGYRWHYRGAIGTVAIEEAAATQTKEFIAVYADSSGKVLWKERYVKTPQNIHWIALEPQAPVATSYQFDKGIPIGLFSDHAGARLDFETVERSSKKDVRTIKVAYQIIGRESVTVPAGTYPDAIKMTMTIRYSDDVEGARISQNIYWFAAKVGIVKFSWDNEVAELLSAELDQRLSS